MRGLFIALIILLCACQPLQQDREIPITLVYSANLNGELEPCGCSEQGDLGGIKRQSTLVQQLRRQDPQLLLISGGGLLSSESERDRLKSKYILKGFTHLAYDALGVQWRDLVYGRDFIKDFSLPWVASNGGVKNFSTVQKSQKKGMDFYFFSWLSPEESPELKMQNQEQTVSSDMSSLAAQLKQAKSQGMTVLSTTYALNQATALLPLQYVDILLIQSRHEVYGEPQRLKNTLVLQPGSRGMRLGKLALVLQGNQLKTWRHDVIDLPKSIGDDPALAGWYEEYNAKVKQAYLDSVQRKQAFEQGLGPYVGESGCQSCHIKEHQAWSVSRHAKAYATLEKVNKAFDPDCIQCHTVGFNQVGGFIDSKSTGDLLNVQCESCHGPGRAHMNAAGKQATPHNSWTKQRICGQCHNASHSPGFSWESYWPKIAHGLKP